MLGRNKKRVKLTLRKETLRDLTSEDLTRVNGAGYILGDCTVRASGCSFTVTQAKMSQTDPCAD